MFNFHQAETHRALFARQEEQLEQSIHGPLLPQDGGDDDDDDGGGDDDDDDENNGFMFESFNWVFLVNTPLLLTEAESTVKVNKWLL